MGHVGSHGVVEKEVSTPKRPEGIHPHSVFAYSRCEKHDSYDAVVAVSWRKIRIALKVT
jgi:hypothetical protein